MVLWNPVNSLLKQAANYLLSTIGHSTSSQYFSAAAL